MGSLIITPKHNKIIKKVLKDKSRVLILEGS